MADVCTGETPVAYTPLLFERKSKMFDHNSSAQVGNPIWR